jgi:hypothetical protein
MVVYLTSLSEQAIYYLGNVSGKVMIFGEMAPNVEGQDDYRQRAYRQFISEGKISRGTVEKTDGKTNELAVKETIGPAVAIATTTMEPKQFNDELQNRGGWFWSDDSASTTKAVMDAQAERAAHPVQADDAVLERTIKAFQQYHETLEALPVVVPFAHQIKLDNDHPTARRLFPMLLNYIKASALLHQHVRERRMMEGRAVIVATADDYDVAYDLTTAGAPRVLETNVKPAREAFDAIIKPYMKQGNSIWTAVAMDLLKRPEPTVRRWLEDYAESGLIVCLSRDGRKKVYTLVDDARDHFVQSLGLVAPSQLRQSDWAI